MRHRPGAFSQGDELRGKGKAVAGSLYSNGDSIMLLDRRHGSIELKVWKLERAFEEQEGAGGKPSVAVWLALLRRSPLRMEVT